MKCPKCEGQARRRQGVGFDDEYRCGECGHKWDPDEEYRKWLYSLPKSTQEVLLEPTPRKPNQSGSTYADLARENKRLRCELAWITAQRNRFEKMLTERKEKRKRT